MRYKRSCPECNADILHSKKKIKNAIIKNLPCIKCRIQSTRGNSIELIRKCQNCNIDIKYSNIYNYNTAVKKNTKCIICRGSENRKKYNESISSGIIKHPNLGKILSIEDKINCINKTIKSGKLNGMHGTNNYNIWLEKFGKDIADEKLLIWKDKERKALSGEKNPMYGKPSPAGSGNGWQGYYNNLKFRSLLELSFIVNICNRFNFKVETCETRKYLVKYELNGINRTYYPDFILNNKYVIEVKPKNLQNSYIVKIKAEYAKKQFNMLGLKYKMIDCKRIKFEELKKLVDSNIVKFDKRYTIKYKNMSKKRLILVGKSACGKDHLRQLLENKGYIYATSYTTRPARENEVNGKDYNFLSRETFQNMVALEEFYEYVEFNTWFYGTTKKQFFGESDIFIMTPAGLSHLTEEDREESLVILLDMPLEIRYERLNKRGDVDKVDRRIKADEEDFKDFKDFDIRITNPEFGEEILPWVSIKIPETK